MNKIKRAVENYRESKNIFIQDVAVDIFPNQTPQVAREKLSRLMHSHSFDSLKIKDAMAICKTLGITINELLSDYENT